MINPADVPTSGKEHANKNGCLDSRKLARKLDNGLKVSSWSGSSLEIMESDVVKQHDVALCNLLRELRFLRL